MNDEFFAVVKLITGEELLGLINVFDDGITIENALILEDMSIFEGLIETPSNASIKLSKWIKSTTDNIQFIKDDKIVTISELIEPGLTVYKRAVLDITRATNTKSVHQEPKQKRKQKYTGHKSTVKDARIKFEKLFKDY